MPTIKIPFAPREYQKPLIDALNSGKKRAFTLWHRRAGKDLVLWNMIIRKATEKKGLYYYFLPTYAQSKKIIWDGINNDGFKFIDYCPREIIKAKNATELKIELINGSIIQLIGTDTYDAIRGTNPIGCVFSEFAFQNPMAWEVVKPILKINGGWAVFNTTPNGKNHAHDMFKMAQDNEDWFCERLTIHDTGILTEADMVDERREGMSEEMIQQEYYCSFDIGAVGSYYAQQITELRKEEHITKVPYIKTHTVHVFMDLGRSDSTAIIFFQRIGKELCIIDYFEENGKDISFYAQYLRSKAYEYGNVYLPHDGFQKRLESPKTVAQQIQEAGFNIQRIPPHKLQNGIDEVRKILPYCYFDKVKTKQLLNCLENYHREWDEKAKVFKPNPKHDWSSHGADAMRYLAIGLQDVRPNDYYEAAKKFVNQSAPLGREIKVSYSPQEWQEYKRSAKEFYT